MDDLFIYEPDSQSEKILLSLCDEVILLKYGNDDKDRQWYEYWRKDTGIIVQKNNPQEPWTVYFVKGDNVKTFCYSYSLEVILKFFDVCGLTVKLAQNQKNTDKVTKTRHSKAKIRSKAGI